MKKLLFVLLAFWFSTPVLAQSTAQQVQPGSLSTSGCPSSRLTPCFVPYSDTNPLPVTPSAPTGTQDTNLKQVNGQTVNVGVGAAGTGTQRVTTSTDSTIGTVTAVTAITNALPAGSNVIGHVIADTGSTTAVTGNVTVVQPTGTNLHAVLDTTSTTAVTQATAASLNATVVGTGTFAVQAAQSGTWTVQPGNTANTTPWLVSLQPTTSGGSSTYTGNITNTAVAVDASPGQVYGYFFYNANSSVCYVQFWNTAQGSVTVGTTAPILSMGIPALGGANVAFPNGIAFSTAITIAATTTRAGGSACASGVDANLLYK